MTLAPMEGRLAVKKKAFNLPDTPIGKYNRYYISNKKYRTFIASKVPN